MNIDEVKRGLDDLGYQEIRFSSSELVDILHALFNEDAQISGAVLGGILNLKLKALSGERAEMAAIFIERLLGDDLFKDKNSYSEGQVDIPSFEFIEDFEGGEA